MNRPYIVVIDEEIVGEFSQLEGAELFARYAALHADKGDKIHIYQIRQTIEVVE